VTRPRVPSGNARQPYRRVTPDRAGGSRAIFRQPNPIASGSRDRIAASIVWLPCAAPLAHCFQACESTFHARVQNPAAVASGRRPRSGPSRSVRPQRSNAPCGPASPPQPRSTARGRPSAAPKRRTLIALTTHHFGKFSRYRRAWTAAAIHRHLRARASAVSQHGEPCDAMHRHATAFAIQSSSPAAASTAEHIHRFQSPCGASNITDQPYNVLRNTGWANDTGLLSLGDRAVPAAAIAGSTALRAMACGISCVGCLAGTRSAVCGVIAGSISGKGVCEHLKSRGFG
jgi:hypothetical protein